MRSRLAIVVLLTCLLAPSLGLPNAGAAAAESGGSVSAIMPKPPKGKGKKCVADTDFMRRYHMSVLNHQRDETVHDGIRTKQFSLKECIDCHAVNGPDAKPVTVASPKHFCRTCHDFASVKIDCFECHASRPDMSKSQRPASRGEHVLHAALEAYLEGKTQ